MHFHPWRAVRALRHITIRWADLPDDVMGYASFDTDTITLARGMTQAERRSTLWHEVHHLLRGRVPAHLQEREERAVDEAAARDLISFEALVDAMLWSNDDRELADELWVDVSMVRARLASLTDYESRTLVTRLEEAERMLP